MRIFCVTNMNIFKRIKNLWLLSEYVPQENMSIRSTDTLKPIDPKIYHELKEAPDGKAEFLSYLSEDEMNKFIKEEELGWKKVYNPIRELFKKNEQ